MEINKKQGIVITHWVCGSKVKEHHKDAVRVGCRYCEGKQFDVLFDKKDEVLQCYLSSSVECIEIN